MTRTLTTLAILAFFWPFWQQYPIRYPQRPVGQPTVQQACPGGRCCLGGRCQLAQPKEQLPKPPAVKMAGEPQEVK